MNFYILTLEDGTRLGIYALTFKGAEKAYFGSYYFKPNQSFEILLDEEWYSHYFVFNNRNFSPHDAVEYIREHEYRTAEFVIGRVYDVD